MKNNKIIVKTISALMVSAAWLVNASADDFNYLGKVDDNWFNASNWNATPTLPVSGVANNIYVKTTAVSSSTLAVYDPVGTGAASSSFDCSSLGVAPDAGMVGHLFIKSGIINNSAALTIGNNGVGALTIENASLIKSAGITFSIGNGSGTGSLTIGNGGLVRFSTSGGQVISVGSDGSGMGTLTILEGGRLELGVSNANGGIKLGTNNSNGVGVVNMRGGIITTAANADGFSFWIGAASNIRNPENKIIGYGTINLTGTGNIGSFTNSGKVIADGYGVDRILTINYKGNVGGSTTNASGRGFGWYAQNGGALQLNKSTVSGQKFGLSDRTSFGAADLVNSFSGQASSTSYNGGTVMVSLLAGDRATDVKGNALLSTGKIDNASKKLADGESYMTYNIWEVDADPAGLVLNQFQIRYDESIFAGLTKGTDFQLLFWDGSGAEWKDVTSLVSMDTTNLRFLYNVSNAKDYLTISANGSGFFALSSLTVVPEPSTWFLLGVGMVLLACTRKFAPAKR